MNISPSRLSAVATDRRIEESCAVPLDCVVFEGLGNRINAIVSSYLQRPCFTLYWSINDHCPVSFEDLFEPLEGIEVVELTGASFFPYSRSTRRICWFYLLKPVWFTDKEFAARAKQGYQYLISKLRHRPTYDLPKDTVGIHFRFHLPAGSSASLPVFLQQLLPWLRQRDPGTVFVTSDDQQIKYEIIKRVQRWGYETAVVDSPLLKHDFDRSKDNLIGLSKELVLFTQCTLGVISNSARSTVVDSCRGFNVPVDRTHDSGKDRRQSWDEDLLK